MNDEFSSLVRRKRRELFSSAREFHQKKKISCSYAYYASVEKERTPEVAIAIEIIEKLQLNLKSALLAWTRDQMPTPQTKEVFLEPNDRPSLSTSQNSFDRSLVVNRMQAKLLAKDPVYWEILLYISTAFGGKQLSIADIAKQFGMDTKTLEPLIQQMHEFGLLDLDSKGNLHSKEWVFVPYDDEFVKLRDLNFHRAFSQFERVDPTQRFRTSITVMLPKTYQTIIESKVHNMCNQIIDLSESEMTKNSVPFTVGVFSSPRFFGS